MRHYIDISAATRLLVEEAELRRLGIRLAIPQERVTLVLDRMALLVPDGDAFRNAGLLPDAALRNLDALHVVAALGAGAGNPYAWLGRLVRWAVARGACGQSGTHRGDVTAVPGGPDLRGTA